MVEKNLRNLIMIPAHPTQRIPTKSKETALIERNQQGYYRCKVRHTKVYKESVCLCQRGDWKYISEARKSEPSWFSFINNRCGSAVVFVVCCIVKGLTD